MSDKYRSATKTIIGAMRILAVDIISDDGVANAAISESADRLEELSLPDERICKWTDNINSGRHNYSTECGNSFYFEIGTVKGNRAKFCMFCGGEIESERQADDS